MKRPILLILVNNAPESATGLRARRLSAPLEDRWTVLLHYRERGKIRSLIQFFRAIFFARPDLVYVMDTAVSGAGAALLAHQLFRQPFVVDTGDCAYQLAVSAGRPGWLGRQIIRLIEIGSLKQAEAVVVRGTFHQRMLIQAGLGTPTCVIRDGVDQKKWLTREANALRKTWGWSENVLCVGMIGSLRWSPRGQTCYGWDLVEALSLLDPALPVRALIIGDGDGRPRLQARAAALGVADRVQWIGRVPYAELSLYTQAMDVAISTQTDDCVGWARTTGKLPEYMAAGRYVLATDVGEATLLLPLEMRLPYQGSCDKNYPQRLARKISELATQGRQYIHAAGASLVPIAREELDYSCLSTRLGALLERTQQAAKKQTPMRQPGM